MIDWELIFGDQGIDCIIFDVPFYVVGLSSKNRSIKMATKIVKIPVE